jgi:K+-transporting ATPase ATPase C chain
VKSALRSGFVLFLLLSLLTGAAYPGLVTLVARVAFPHRANGSLILRDGHVQGSRLIGQPFRDARYFWGRPSATTPTPYNALSSGGSNLGPTNPAQDKAVKARLAELHAAHPDARIPVPVDLVTASASGLDPHISPAAAQYQVPRVARARGLAEERVLQLVRACTEGRTLGLLGEPRVNLLRLNLTLDNTERDATFGVPHAGK